MKKKNKVFLLWRHVKNASKTETRKIFNFLSIGSIKIRSIKIRSIKIRSIKIKPTGGNFCFSWHLQSRKINQKAFSKDFAINQFLVSALRWFSFSVNWWKVIYFGIRVHSPRRDRIKTLKLYFYFFRLYNSIKLTLKCTFTILS